MYVFELGSCALPQDEPLQTPHVAGGFLLTFSVWPSNISMAGLGPLLQREMIACLPVGFVPLSTPTHSSQVGILLFCSLPPTT